MVLITLDSMLSIILGMGLNLPDGGGTGSLISVMMIFLMDYLPTRSGGMSFPVCLMVSIFCVIQVTMYQLGICQIGVSLKMKIKNY